MAYQVEALDALRDFGINFSEEPGCRTRGSVNFGPRGVMDHHTGVNTDVTSMLRDGRGDLDGPLCNFELRRQGHVRAIALGRANHAGAGDYRGLSGNSVWWGIEASSDGKSWTPAQREMYPILNAALLAYCGRDESWVAGHKEYAGYRGKWDPGAWDMNEMRHSTGLVLRGARPGQLAEEDDMYAIAIDLERGEDFRHSVEPAQGFFGKTETLLVLDCLRDESTRVWIWNQNSGGGAVEVVGDRRFTRSFNGGWLHVRNDGEKRVFGALLVKRI